MLLCKWGRLWLPPAGICLRRTTWWRCIGQIGFGLGWGGRCTLSRGIPRGLPCRERDALFLIILVRRVTHLVRRSRWSLLQGECWVMKAKTGLGMELHQLFCSELWPHLEGHDVGSGKAVRLLPIMLANLHLLTPPPLLRTPLFYCYC